jgi:hypothetical protein
MRGDFGFFLFFPTNSLLIPLPTMYTLKLTHYQHSVHVQVAGTSSKQSSGDTLASLGTFSLTALALWTVDLRPDTIYTRFAKEFPDCSDPSPVLRWLDSDNDWIRIRQGRLLGIQRTRRHVQNRLSIRKSNSRPDLNVLSSPPPSPLLRRPGFGGDFEANDKEERDCSYPFWRCHRGMESAAYLGKMLKHMTEPL